MKFTVIMQHVKTRTRLGYSVLLQDILGSPFGLVLEGSPRLAGLDT